MTIKLKEILLEALYKNAILYLGWIKRNNHDVMMFDIESGEDETHHNYLMGLPPEWRNETDDNLIRFRYRKDMNTVYWWEFSPPTEDEKISVEQWIGKNLGQKSIEHRIIPANRDNMDFFKSHGED